MPLWAAGRRIIAARVAARNAVSAEDEVGAASIATQDIIIICPRIYCTCNVDNFNAIDCHAICWVSRRTSVEVILLDVDPIRTDAGYRDIAIHYIANLFHWSAPLQHSFDLLKIDLLRLLSPSWS